MYALPTTHRIWVPGAGLYAHFIHRDKMRRMHEMPSVKPGFIAPPTPLPVDCTGNLTVQMPMDGNDAKGDCGEAMADHVNRIFRWMQGKGVQMTTAVSALISQYMAVSGGDNGMNESMLVGPQGVWTAAGGGIAMDPASVVADSLDIPPDSGMLQYCIDQFYAVPMAWSVPDLFIQTWQSGQSFLSAMTPDPANGHYTPLTDIDVSGNYHLLTWGGWSLVSQSFVDSVQPVYFTVFSAQQFAAATGYDSHGRHVSTQAEKWVAIGGSAAKVAAVVAMFPPIGAPPGPINPPSPTPQPTPAPAGLTLAQIIADLQVFAQHYPRYAGVIAAIESYLTALWPQGARMGAIPWANIIAALPSIINAGVPAIIAIIQAFQQQPAMRGPFPFPHPRPWFPPIYPPSPYPYYPPPYPYPYPPPPQP